MRDIPLRKLRQMFFEIRREAGNPPIQLVSWEVATRYRGGEEKGVVGYCLYGLAVSISPHQTIKEARNTIWHEIGHVLFRSKPHWWIYTYGAVMSRFDAFGRYISAKRKYLTAFSIGYDYRHFPSFHPLINDFPTRKECLKMTRDATNRLKRKRGMR